MPSSQFMSAAGTALNDLLLAQVLSAVSGIDINVLGNDIRPFAGLQSWATSLEGQASAAINQANEATANSTANASAIAAITSAQTATTTGGNNINEQFATTGALSAYSNWVCGGSNLGSGVELYVQPAGTMGIYGSPSATGSLYALNTQVLATDDHKVTVVCQDTGNQNANSSIIIRAAADMSSFVYANIFGDSGAAYIGYGSFNSSTGAWTFNDWRGVSVSQSAGQTWTFEVSGSTYTLARNGNPVLAWTDSAGNATVGSSNRSVGVLDAVNYYSGYTYGWNFASFNASDLSSPAIVGTTWSLVRLSTGGVALPGSGWQFLGSGTLDTQQYANGVTINDLGTGVVQIVQPGPYVVGTVVGVNTAAGTSAVFQSAVYKYTAATGTTALLLPGSQVQGNNVYQAASGPGVIQCAAGDHLRPAFYQAGSNNVVGNAAGDATFFSGALCGAG